MITYWLLFKVRELVFNLHMILSDTVKMKEYQEVLLICYVTITCNTPLAVQFETKNDRTEEAI